MNETTALGRPWTERLVAATLRVAYQPYVEAATGVVAGYEALARLAPSADAPAAAWLQPGDFVPQVEAAGLGLRLTELVCARALDEAPALLGPGQDLAVNVPLDILLGDALHEVLAALLADAAIPAGRLLLELTESQLVADVHALGAALTRLRAAGVRVALDDAGPAVPAHATLIELPFSVLKLDRMLIAQALPEAAGRAELETVIGRARGRGMVVIAEGIEDQAMASVLRGMGADMLQGFHFARPMPLAEACAWRDARATACSP